MSDKQLTVAELLARASKDSSTPTSRTRRRRRSLEEGGISVAELTGSIPRVDQTPEQPRHTAQPLDAATPSAHSPTEPVADSAAAQQQEHEATHEAASTPRPAEDQASRGEHAAAEPATEHVAGHAAEHAATENAAEDAVTERSKADSTSTYPAAEHAASEHGSAARATNERDEAEASRTRADAERTGTRKSQDDHDTMVLHVVKEGDPVRFTTDSFPAVTPAQAASAPTGETAEPVRETPAEVPAGSAASAHPAEPADDHRDDALGSAIPEGSRFSDKELERRGHRPEHLARQDDEQGGVQPAEQDEGRSVSLVMVVAMTVVAVCIGAAIFKGFQMLWGNFNHAITAVLAVAVTAAIVGIVHALRTERDKLSMIVAGVVGLVLTFGPSLIVGI